MLILRASDGVYTNISTWRIRDGNSEGDRITGAKK
jgi:hypothetical protein